MQKPTLRTWLLLLGLTAFTASAPILASDTRPNDGSKPPSQWTPYVRGGYVHQFDTDLDNGGSFDVDRFFIQGGLSYSMGPQRRISLAISGGRDQYDFSGDFGLTAEPWDRVDRFGISTPVTWALDQQWTLFAIPTVRFYGESGASSSDSVTGGALAGFSYRISDNLTIGPGIGVLSQLEDSTSVFPILIVDWKITDRLSLSTGQGLGATQGPGLNLNYRFSDTWSFGLGGRYESLRFRLDDQGVAPDGVGEDRSIPIYLSATFNRGRDLQISVIGGAELNGELRIDDDNGRSIAKEDYETAPFLGATLNIRF
ncbi:MAG: DUF6268 family outer membrane beta-barrel protein [Candidatus Competibacteraceae bacterium]|jgi:hypothetical protein|nr:DUF6268 family outer membrane beta-barrel protein [Candidatus Competibacteraceae bacterium]